MRFADIHVPENIKKQLIRSVESGRVGHTQLFYGLEGTESLPLAVAYAQYVNCEHRGAEDSCGECPSCRQFQNLAHPDLHFFFPHKTGNNVSSADFYDDWREIFKETGGAFSLNDWYERIGMENKQGIINKEDVELLLSKAMLKPYEAPYKVFIIWMADKLQSQMAHKLLKNLEEPDEHTLFLLITESYDQMLGTILSRCQMLKIPRFSTEETALILQQELHCDEAEARQRALMSGNNLTRALHDTENVTDPMFPLFQTMMRCAYSLYFQNKSFEFSQATQWVDEMSKMGREQQKYYLRYALDMLRKCMLKNTGLNNMAVSHADEDEWMEKFKPFVHTDNITPFYTFINQAILGIEANANAKILFMDLLFELGRYFKKKA